MKIPSANPWPRYFDSLRRVFNFYLFLGRKTRRTRFFFLFGFFPVVISLIIKFQQIFAERTSWEGIYLFSNIIMLFYLQFIILILALFFGTSVPSEEIEGKTLSYLVTRPVPKSAFITGKYTAYALIVIGMVALGLVFSFAVLNMNRLFDFSIYRILFRYLGVLILGILAYTALFVFFGSLLKRSVFFGLLFCFGWESVIQYFPGSTQRFAIAHYLKSFLPPSSGGRFSLLTFRLEPTRPAIAILVLILVTAGFLGLACLLFSQKEHNFED